ncbi:hypothetical protein [Paraburkholderia silvatlantica]|uniref:Transcriptional regulator of acetoin/glycerol metabolism n=1 Tax=Paraburkholderia silvatlantica TaxID=321895 RepID=A0ABR6FFN5_9BURK|nr:hypothetical protein [Paraburkholderia silvatlantica]MBB2926238.1 transcriptional regulator of acetoin/glycerol metabolism [Paraburkholderia silvatlantica]
MTRATLLCISNDCVSFKLCWASSNVSCCVGVREGSFREDLYFRLHVVPIHLPPLSARIESVADAE